MDSSDLAFFTTDELVEEILRRKTFLGVVIQSEEDYRAPHWGPERIFKVQYNSNLNPEHAARLIDVVAEYMQGEQFYVDGEKQ